jgi:uncharacterized protein (TIRG00374 family)
VWPLIASAHFLYVGLAIGLVLLIRVLTAWKWKLLLHYGGIELSLGYLLRIILVSDFAGALLPSVGVDIIRTAAVGRRTGYTSAAVSTIADRIMGIVAMVLWSLTAALIALWAAPDLRHVLLPIVVLCAGVIVILIALLSDTTMRIVQRVSGCSRAGARRERVDSSGLRRLIRLAANKTIIIHQDLRGLFAKPPVFISVFCLNVLFQGARITLFYLLFLTVGVHIAIVYHIIFAPLIILVTLLPFSILGIGVKEVAVVFFYTRVGVDPASAFAVSIWTYIMSIPPRTVGGFLYLLGPSSELAKINKDAPKKAKENEQA